MAQDITRGLTRNPTRSRLNSPGLSGMGWTDAAEMLNGRLAMVGFILAIATELLTGEGVIGQIQALLPK